MRCRILKTLNFGEGRSHHKKQNTIIVPKIYYNGASANLSYSVRRFLLDPKHYLFSCFDYQVVNHCCARRLPPRTAERTSYRERVDAAQHAADSATNPAP